MTETVPNFRDLGGTPTADGAIVRPGSILRSAMPAARDGAPDGISWPPSVVIDLRSLSESEPQHPLQGLGSQVFKLPLLAALKPGATPPSDLPGLYRVMLDYADHNLVEIVRVAGDHSGSTLIHCAAGKDRTGVAVALLLRLVGVAREHVVADYLTSLEHAEAIGRRLALLPGYEDRKALPKSFLAVPVEALEGVLDVWDQHEGGTEGWLRRAGAAPGLTDKLRQNLLVG